MILGRLVRLIKKGLSDIRVVEYPIEPDSSSSGTGPYYLDWRGRQDPAVMIDGEGRVRTRASSGDYYANPVAIAFHALATHTKLVKHPSDCLRNEFLFHAEELRTSQDECGGWRYPVAVPRYSMQPGWYSGMAQGLALSVFSRAYHVSGDESYIRAIEKATHLLLTPSSDNGCSDYDEAGRPFFEECPSMPSNHILNGAIFAILGLIDASTYQSGLPLSQSLERLEDELPRYDLGFWSRYDQMYSVPSSNAYHSLHISQLRVLGNITGVRQFGVTADRWKTYQSQFLNRAQAAVAKARFVGSRHEH